MHCFFSNTNFQNRNRQNGTKPIHLHWNRIETKWTFTHQFWAFKSTTNTENRLNVGNAILWSHALSNGYNCGSFSRIEIKCLCPRLRQTNVKSDEQLLRRCQFDACFAFIDTVCCILNCRVARWTRALTAMKCARRAIHLMENDVRFLDTDRNRKMMKIVRVCMCVLQCPCCSVHQFN